MSEKKKVSGGKAQAQLKANKASSITKAKLKEAKGKKGKKQHFLRLRMWVGYLVSLVEKDRGKIPNNIGNRVLITNNMVVTKSAMSTYIRVDALSLDTPVGLLSYITDALREKGSTAIVDFIFKNSRFDVNVHETGMESRIAGWEKALTQDYITDREKEVAARCLYTVDIARSGEQLYNTRFFIVVRAETGSELTKAEKIVHNYLNSIHASYTPIFGDLKQVLQYTSLASNLNSKEVKDMKSIVTSKKTMMQMAPNNGSINDRKGLYLGVDMDNYQPVYLDLENITNGRTIYIYAPAGGGKTVEALNLNSDAREQEWATCIQDIKGNEFESFVEGTNGYTVSMQQGSAGYINTFKMIASETTDIGADMYFKERVSFSKVQMRILSGFRDPEDLSLLDEFLDEFLTAVYINLGVLSTNRATWGETLNLNPFTIYRMFVDYMSPEVQKKYERIARRLCSEYKMNMSKDGSKSYIFMKEYNYADILNADSLRFDFSILKGSAEKLDPIMFKLRFEYMKKLNSDYAAHKYKCGKKVLTTLEEVQAVVNDPDIFKGYVDAVTLRRAQGQTILLLGNSFSALKNNPVARPLIENISGLLLGRMTAEARRDIVDTFGFSKEIDKRIEELENSKFDNAFLFVNRMESNPTLSTVKLLLDPEKKYKLFTPT